ncbi:MAG: 7-cyano-7-deazaguanine synthase, partial [Muribaculaceae bacterium]|nr:7-cyano-7-deazaguanine synthase [Muribaculaceae bacterium]
MTKDSVIILSGGMDSCTMLHEYRDHIALAITFDYGSTQNHREQQYAVKQCQAL